MGILYRGLLIFIGVIGVVVIIFSIVILNVYRSPDPLFPWVTSTRDYYETRSNQWYIQKNPVFLLVYRYVFGDGDKYVYRPPRIVVTHTYQGRKGYMLYGMVTFWDADKKILGMNSYAGRNLLFVRFDPDADGSLAFIPKLDVYGNLSTIGDSDLVGDSKNPKFVSLFCPSDVVSVVVTDPNSFTHSSQESPIVPVSITLSQRLCQQ